MVWRKAALFDAGRGSLVTWLYTLSRNCLLNHVRHEGRMDIEIDVPEPATTLAPGDRAKSDARVGERRRKLAATIAGYRPSSSRCCIARTGAG